jgi:hypothetical protein
MKKGTIFTAEHCKKLSEAAKAAGRKPPSRIGSIPWNKGKTGIQKAWNSGILAVAETK